MKTLMMMLFALMLSLSVIAWAQDQSSSQGQSGQSSQSQASQGSQTSSSVATHRE